MNNLGKIFLLIVFVFCGSQNVTAQKKNAAYVTAGIYYSLSYDRVLKTSEDERRIFYARLHGGNIPQLFYASDDALKFRHVGLSLGLLTGKSKGKFEINLGAGHIWAFTQSQSRGMFFLDDRYIIPNINVGYRYQSNKVVFRAGIGVPELVYLSFGFRF